MEEETQKPEAIISQPFFSLFEHKANEHSKLTPVIKKEKNFQS